MNLIPGAEYVIILTDLDEDQCITKTKEPIKSEKDPIVIVSVKTIESWYLADSKAMSTVFGNRYYHEQPENIAGSTIELIRQEFLNQTGRGIGSSRIKTKLAKYMVKNGFDLTNSAKHPNCPSAKYFVNKLTELSKI